MNEVNNHIVLDIRKLNIGYRKNKSVLKIADGISFTLGRGEMAAVIGVNGIGKSTLLKTLSGVIPKLSGDILLNGKPFEAYSLNNLAKELSLVLTETIPSGNLTVQEILALGRQPYTNWMGTLSDTDREVINRVLRAMALEKLRNRKCHELSDGQLQKVMIARAMVQNTSLIILDEPTTHLDLYHKASILKHLQTICHQSGKTILFSSHELNLALQLCDKILLMLPQSSYFGSPAQLIEQGVFDNVFPEDLIYFDPVSSSFKVNK